MPPSEAPNPERRSTNAMICFCTGLGLLALSWFMGVGAAFTAAFAGGLAGAAMGVTGAVALMLTACLGVFLMFIGIVWIVVRVIADQTGDELRQRYRDVQR
ncbi:MAG: hypothetical protein QM759_00065 [Terricaulis sp.]